MFYLTTAAVRRVRPRHVCATTPRSSPIDPNVRKRRILTKRDAPSPRAHPGRHRVLYRERVGCDTFLQLAPILRDRRAFTGPGQKSEFRQIHARTRLRRIYASTYTPDCYDATSGRNGLTTRRWNDSPLACVSRTSSGRSRLRYSEKRSSDSLGQGHVGVRLGVRGGARIHSTRVGTLGRGTRKGLGSGLFAWPPGNNKITDYKVRVIRFVYVYTK